MLEYARQNVSTYGLVVGNHSLERVDSECRCKCNLVYDCQVIHYDSALWLTHRSLIRKLDRRTLGGAGSYINVIGKIAKKLFKVGKYHDPDF
jgi:hypothetical protein